MPNEKDFLTLNGGGVVGQVQEGACGLKGVERQSLQHNATFAKGEAPRARIKETGQKEEVGEEAEEGQAADEGGGVALHYQSQNEAGAEPEGGIGVVKVLLGGGYGGWPLLSALLPLNADLLGRLTLEEVADNLSSQVPCHPSTIALLGSGGGVDKLVGDDEGGGREEAGEEE